MASPPRPRRSSPTSKQCPSLSFPEHTTTQKEEEEEHSTNRIRCAVLVAPASWRLIWLRQASLPTPPTTTTPVMRPSPAAFLGDFLGGGCLVPCCGGPPPPLWAMLLSDAPHVAIQRNHVRSCCSLLSKELVAFPATSPSPCWWGQSGCLRSGSRRLVPIPFGALALMGFFSLHGAYTLCSGGPPPHRGAHATACVVLLGHIWWLRAQTLYVIHSEPPSAFSIYAQSPASSSPPQFPVPELSFTARWLPSWSSYDDTASPWDPGSCRILNLRRHLRSNPSVAGVHLLRRLDRPAFNRRFARSFRPGARILDAPATPLPAVSSSSTPWTALPSCPLQIQCFNVKWSSFEDLFVIRTALII